jgi:hypothetical protein
VDGGESKDPERDDADDDDDDDDLGGNPAMIF